MQSQEFEHVLAAAAEVTGEEEFVVIGSQAILGSIAAPPSALLVSMEVDIYPRHAPEAAPLRQRDCPHRATRIRRPRRLIAPVVVPHETAHAPLTS